MPALPWSQRQPLDPSATYVAMASRLPLRRHRAVPGFLRDTLRIRRQLAEAPGLVGYGLKADLVRKTFWTFSVWEDQAALHAFARTDPHRQIVRRLAARMGKSGFATFTVAGDAVPTTWAEMTAPLADADGDAGSATEESTGRAVSP